MTLANYMNVDEDMLACDLAETYHIYDFKELPAKKVALFSVGLRENSRIKMKLSKVKMPMDALLLAKISDELAMYLWARSGGKEDSKPSIILPRLFTDYVDDQGNKEIMAFDSGADFEKERLRILKGG